MEKEIAKLDGQVVLLEMEKNAIESKSILINSDNFNLQ
jgi:hypothetical protein